MALAGPATKVDRPQGPARAARPDRQPPPRHPRRAELQHGAALGRRALARRRDGHAEAPGRHHAAAAMGARRRRLHRAPVRRKAPADHRRDQRRRARYAGVPAAPLRPRAAQRRGAARRRLHQGHAEPAGRRDRARCATATRRACCSPSPMPASSMRRSPRGRSCRSTIRSTRRAISCASSTGSASPA